MSRRLIVTGGAGFIGSNIVEALNRRGHKDIIVVDRADHPDKQRNLDTVTVKDCIDQDDFRRDVLARDADLPADVVIHMGACSSTTETNEAYLLDNNVAYSRELCGWCLRHGIRFIYASSGATYGDGSHGYSDDPSRTPTLEPLNLYGESKRLFDLWAMEQNLFDRIVGIKYFNVYGPREDHKGAMRSVVNKAFHEVRKTGRIGLFKSYRDDYEDGEQDRDFVFVRDAVAVTLFFCDHPDVSGLFNCGTGAARTWIDLARAVFKAMDLDPNIHFIEMPETMRPNYQYHTQADLTRLRGAGYTDAFTSLEHGVNAYIRHYLTPSVESCEGEA